MQNSVAQSELICSGRYIKRFVSEIDNLYGWQHVTISVHLLSHLQQSVKDFGQPWSHSAFIFGAFNAEIKQAVKSSNGVAHQICKAMQRKIALPKLEDDIKDYLSDHQQLFLEQMKFTGLRLGNPHLTIGPTALMGKPRESGCRAESIGAL
ncbi:hypothetical protein FOCC_FOCC015393 [Frankliniella occidentalis]|nr:hypothetical protein FOCC_FOCC015393 [Frankliniella occidentalis]